MMVDFAGLGLPVVGDIAGYAVAMKMMDEVVVVGEVEKGSVDGPSLAVAAL